MKQATSVIPIVFAVANEPVDSGLVASLARPGGNITGLSMQQTDLAGKRLELIREVIPGLRQLGIVANISNRGAALDMGQAQDAARTLGLTTVTREIRRGEGWRCADGQPWRWPRDFQRFSTVELMLRRAD